MLAADEKNRVIDEMSKVVDKNLHIAHENTQLKNNYDNVAVENKKLIIEIGDLRTQLKNQVIDEEVEKRKAMLENEIQQLMGLIEERKNELALASNHAAELTAHGAQKLAELEGFEASMKELERRKEELQAEINGLKDANDNLTIEWNELKDRLEEGKIRYHEVLNYMEGAGNGWDITPGDPELVKVIEELVDKYGGSYPSLRRELLKVS